MKLPPFSAPQMALTYPEPKHIFEKVWENKKIKGNIFDNNLVTINMLLYFIASEIGLYIV